MEQVNAFGLPLTVGSVEELRDEARKAYEETGKRMPYLVVRVADSRHQDHWPTLRARRTVTPCTKCQELCWLDPKSYIAPEYVVITCTRCLKPPSAPS